MPTVHQGSRPAGSGAPGPEDAAPAPPPLVELPVATLAGALDAGQAGFVAEALRRGRRVDCFEFVPSEPLALHALLAALPPGRYCEWGSGIGIGLALAESLGHAACGIEVHPELAAASRALLRDFGFRAAVLTGSCFELSHEADVYFCYCWSSQRVAVEAHFAATAPDDAVLIVAHGAADLRCKRKPSRVARPPA